MSTPKVDPGRAPRNYVHVTDLSTVEARWVPTVVHTRNLLVVLIVGVLGAEAVVAALKLTHSMWGVMAALVVFAIYPPVMRLLTHLFKITPEEARGLRHHPDECDACANGTEHPKVEARTATDPLTEARAHLAKAQAALDKVTTR